MSDPAPDDLELLRQFVNTREPDHQLDSVATPEALREWLASRSLLAGDAVLSEHEHSRVLEFREAIRALGVANGGGPEDPEVAALLNRIATGVTLSVELGPDGEARLRPIGTGVDEALGHLYSILYRSIVDGSFARLKACANDTCQWLYFDHSKNQSRRWCDMQTCGNAANARAYRRRRRSGCGD